jgi:hypothetical protein
MRELAVAFATAIFMSGKELVFAGKMTMIAGEGKSANKPGMGDIGINF